MNISDEFEEIGFGFHENGLIPVLEKVSMARMTPVELLGIACEQPAHDGSQGTWPRLQKKMGMLCEASDYVKLDFRSSRISPISWFPFPPSIVTTPHNFML